MKRYIAAFTVFAVGCAPMQVERRTERGPLLRTYQQEVPLGQRTVAATVTARWPRLDVRLVSSEACRTEVHEEYAEEVITERTDPAAAPALSGGIANVVVGGGLLLASSLLSNEPDRDAIDRQGRYGASSRQLATRWGVVLVAIGVPALVTGIVQMARSGEERETRKVDEVASLRDRPCDPRPAEGVVEFVGQGPQAALRTVKDGAVSLGAEDLDGADVVGLLLEGTPVMLAEEDAMLLNAFSACAQLQRQPMDAQALGERTQEQLLAMHALAARCAKVPGSPGAEWMEALGAAVTAAQSGGEAPAPAGEVEFESFEDAVAKLKPSLRVAAGGADAEKLRNADVLKGQAVQLVGVLTQRQGPDSVVVQVGDVKVLVLMDPQRAWASDFARGSRVELVGVVEGEHPLGEASAPMVSAAWMRPAL